MVAIASFQREAILKAVRDMYTAVAERPDADYHFPIGRHACAQLGYPDNMLDGVPEAALESFAGVGYPFAAAVVRRGDHVLDLGSGSGTDALICARLVGSRGRVYALDMTDRMREKLQRTAQAAGVRQLRTLAGDAEQIPLPDASVDVVSSNGVLNLVPNKRRAIEEIARVLKPGGRLQLSDIALERPVSERYRQNPQMWAECVVGAVEEDQYLAMLRAAGFDNIERIAELDYFRLSGNDTTREVAGLFRARSITLSADRPAAAVAVSRSQATRRAAGRLLRELAGTTGALIAWLACAGLPAVLAAFGAVGLGSITTHAIMFPAFVALLGASVALLWRSGRLRDDRRPFWLACAGATVSAVVSWLALTGVYPVASAWSHLGLAAVVVASLWDFRQSRQPRNCLLEMEREAEWRRRRGAAGHHRWRRIGAALFAAAALYAVHWSVALHTTA